MHYFSQYSLNIKIFIKIAAIVKCDRERPDLKEKQIFTNIIQLNSKMEEILNSS